MAFELTAAISLCYGIIGAAIVGVIGAVERF